MTYSEWEEKQGLNGASPEAHYAEMAWNQALKDAISIVSNSASAAEDRDEIYQLITGKGKQ